MTRLGTGRRQPIGARLICFCWWGVVTVCAAATGLALASTLWSVGRDQSTGQPTALVIGDSQALGASIVDPNWAWVARGVQSVGYLPWVQGAGGTGFTVGRTIDERRVDSYPVAYPGWIKPTDPQLVVIEGGGNDVGSNDERIAASARDLLEQVRAEFPDAPVVMVGPIGDGEGRRAEVSDILAEVARSTGTFYVDTSDWWVRFDLARHLVDAKHLSFEGHALATDRFADALRETGIAVATAGAPARREIVDGNVSTHAHFDWRRRSVVVF
jgi:lysophospholipase L1-like esterase